jgi:predicted short-subunit dehydrogenase-like oxidoreductase (DUF2520 family)
MLARSMAQMISIIGAGRVGRALGRRLRGRGWRIGAVVTRFPATARAAVRAIGTGNAFSCITGEVFAADLILLGTPDDVLPTVARSLARVGGSKCKGKVILHTSATLDRTVLAPVARLGAATGSLHPMQAFGGKVIPKLSGVVFAIEGDDKARRMAQSIAQSLGGITVTIETRDKPIYHAAAVLAAGSAYPLIEAGVQMLMRIGFTRRSATQTLLPLIHQILDNIERIGPRAAWTGPLSRGDYGIVARHAKALRGYPREFRESYAALALLAARVLSKNPAAALKKSRRTLEGR